MFKVGDRVKVIGGSGQTLVVRKVLSNKVNALVQQEQFANGFSFVARVSRLTLSNAPLPQRITELPTITESGRLWWDRGVR